MGDRANVALLQPKLFRSDRPGFGGVPSSQPVPRRAAAARNRPRALELQVQPGHGTIRRAARGSQACQGMGIEWEPSCVWEMKLFTDRNKKASLWKERNKLPSQVIHLRSVGVKMIHVFQFTPSSNLK